MKYWITKDCGSGWDESEGLHAWGVSHEQKKLAERIAVDDVLLHYIYRADAWAGYSTVTGVCVENTRDTDPDWKVALPFMIPIKSGVWLTMDESEATSTNRDLHTTNYRRQRTFTAIPEVTATLIIEVIQASKGSSAVSSDGFKKRWNIDAENYYWNIIRRQSKGKCWLCGETAISWCDKQKELKGIPVELVQQIGDGFLDLAHIEARSDDGKMAPDNIRALCPNCHRIVDRLDHISPGIRKKLLSSNEQ